MGKLKAWERMFSKIVAGKKTYKPVSFTTRFYDNVVARDPGCRRKKLEKTSNYDKQVTHGIHVHKQLSLVNDVSL